MLDDQLIGFRWENFNRKHSETRVLAPKLVEVCGLTFPANQFWDRSGYVWMSFLFCLLCQEVRGWTLTQVVDPNFEYHSWFITIQEPSNRPLWRQDCPSG